MSRSVWKGPYVNPKLLKKAREVRDSGKFSVIKTWSRSTTIIPLFMNLTFGVYNGKKFVPVQVTETMMGKKLGEFSPTRTHHGYGADKKAKKR